MGRELISLLTTPAILDQLCQLTTRILACDCSSIILWQPEEKAYGLKASVGTTPEQQEVSRVLKIPHQAMAGLLACLGRSDEEVVQVRAGVIQDLGPDTLLRQLGVTVGLAVALRWGQELIGIQTARYQGRAEPFSPQQERVARGMVQLASLALENARLLEELRPAKRLKEDFLDAVSHELRTPLNIIIGYTELLSEEAFGGLTQEQLHALRGVDRSARRLLELITGMLDISRFEEKLPVEIRPVRVAELVEELRQETEEVAENPRLTLVWRVAPDLPVLYNDRVKLKIVLRNLIDNVIKFTEEGTITVDVRPRVEGIALCVSDTGIGIALEILPTIFELFRRGNSSARYVGVGLGLYVARRLVDTLEGAITVESAVGAGSTFCVQLPIAHSTFRHRALDARGEA